MSILFSFAVFRCRGNFFPVFCFAVIEVYGWNDLYNQWKDYWILAYYILPYQQIIWFLR